MPPEVNAELLYRIHRTVTSDSGTEKSPVLTMASCDSDAESTTNEPKQPRGHTMAGEPFENANG